GMGLLHTSTDDVALSLWAGASLATRPLEITLAPVDFGILPRSEDSRYNWDVANGETVCIDRNRGQLVSRYYCEARLLRPASAEAAGRVPIGKRGAVSLVGGHRSCKAAGSAALAAA